jgi:hypothetical protein
VRKDYEARFKNDGIIEGLKKAYEVGFKKGFRMAKLEDMPWLSKDEYEEQKKKRKKHNKQQFQQHLLKQLYSRYSSNNNNKNQADD